MVYQRSRRIVMSSFQLTLFKLSSSVTRKTELELGCRLGRMSGSAAQIDFGSGCYRTPPVSAFRCAGWLELGSLTDSPLPQAHLCFFPRFPFPLTSLLQWSSFPGGDDWASGGAIRHVFAQPFAGDEHPPGMPAPSLSFPLLCETEHPKP